MSFEWQLPAEDPVEESSQYVVNQDSRSHADKVDDMNAMIDDVLGRAPSEGPTRLGKVQRRAKKNEQAARAGTQAGGIPQPQRGKRRLTGDDKLRDLEDQERKKKRLAQEREHNRKLLDYSLKREEELMNGGSYFRMKDEVREREKAMRDARRNKMEGRQHIDRVMKHQELAVLEQRQQRVRDIVKDFYSSRDPKSTRAIGEIVTVVPQHNVGFVELLGDANIPEVLSHDSVFMKNNQKKLLFDGVSVLHQPLMTGDIVEFDFEPNFVGTETSKDDKRHMNTDSKWVATNLQLRHNARDNLPFRDQLIPLEVRRYLLQLLDLIESEADLPLYCKIVQEFQVWRRLLGEPYTNKPAQGLMDWHVLLILSIGSRRWLERANMPLMLHSFFNAFTGTHFLDETLPMLIQGNMLSPPVLVKAAKLIYLYKRHTEPSVRNLYDLLVAAREHIKHQNADAYDEVGEILKKLLEVMDNNDSFPKLLLRACGKGYNTLRVKDKDELQDVDRILAAEKRGDSIETDGLDTLPRLDEFRTEDSLDPRNLPRNLEFGSWGTPENYTRTAFELLRADTYREFQYSMYHKIHKWKEYEESTDTSFKFSVGRPTSMMQLTGVLGVNYTGGTTAGRLCYTVRFRLWEPIQEAWLFRMYEKGNLVALTLDRFASTIWWAVVSHRDQVLLSEGIVGLEFVSGDPRLLQKKLQELQRSGEDKECWIVEAKTVFFAGYRPVMEALQLFARNAKKEGRCPFEDFLVYGQNGTRKPQWVEHNKETFASELKRCTAENTFDASQERAIRGLENNFLLVQGPPGTGKSYTGVKMVDVILRTRYAALDRMNANPEKRMIQENMAEARNYSEQYQELQTQCDKDKDKIMALKVKRDGAKRSDLKRSLRVEIDVLMKGRDAKKKRMREIDNQQSLLFAEIMRLEQKREKETQALQLDSGPIQIITYKNHSLDEFMMDVMPSVRASVDEPTRKEGLVRFGSRSQCEELQQYNVNEHVRRFDLEPQLQAYGKVLHGALRTKVDLLKTIGAEISHLQAGNLTVECMIYSMTETQAKNFGSITEHHIENWRGQPAAEVLVSLHDSVKAALDADKIREQDSDEESDDGMPKVSDLQNQRDMYQTKAEQEAEDKQREKFIGGFSPVLPDTTYVLPKPISFDSERVDDLESLTQSQREELARFWVQRHLVMVEKLYQRLKAEYIYTVSAQHEFRQQSKCEALQHAQVIGLTVTGCTINKELLNNIQPTILIVEEAAEILESQIISCLNQKTIQQVVLVGDHKQLRPIVRDYAIARDCRLDMSLFERMANNNIPVHNLTNQRRMVPQISQFVRPLYRELRDDDSLKPRKMQCEGSGEIRNPGDLPGLGKPVWFWSHESPETKSSVGLSVVNPMEVKMVVWLVKYFLARGLSINQMTVLTPYKGQLRELKDALENSGVSRPDMVCTVDRFQGDENDLMIVSLVRTKSLTEFVKAPDRMCVLLSRARFGMVILGSSLLLDNPDVPHWQRTIATLAQNQWIGPRFPMRCDRHPEGTRDTGLDVTELLEGEVADSKIENFCTKICNSGYRQCKQKQKHKCTRNCHPGDHNICTNTCGLTLTCNHTCKQQCGICAANDCVCTESMQEKGKCYYWKASTAPDGRSLTYKNTRHLVTREGCGGTIKKCERSVWVRLACGHYFPTRCDKWMQISDNLDQARAALSKLPCRDCAAGLPPFADAELEEENGLPPILEMPPELQLSAVPEEDAKAISLGQEKPEVASTTTGSRKGADEAESEINFVRELKPKSEPRASAPRSEYAESGVGAPISEPWDDRMMAPPLKPDNLPPTSSVQGAAVKLEPNLDTSTTVSSVVGSFVEEFDDEPPPKRQRTDEAGSESQSG
eukprot:TRINITY_DN16596_c0_g1_i1.p1 TRINITY_DN16596_c0_g1~~TRINITY_DN16596_c0_g1_i1.p1  ORF type:complete len:1861 (+),score=636.71 TRINITY_DN16596_c0_g1_i1:235-5817(+)